jgi:hypothetical protein
LEDDIVVPLAEKENVRAASEQRDEYYPIVIEQSLNTLH